MTDKTVQDLFESYFHYWTVKFKLNKKYKFIIKKDNRIDCHAFVQPEGNHTYLIKYNTNRLRIEYKIVNVVLHEIGHLVHDFRTGNDIDHEAVAEFFALDIMKKEKPDLYRQAVNWDLKVIKSDRVDEIHKQGYIKALQKMGEI